MTDRIEHGGEVDGFAERYGIPRARWLDLSTGINPNGYPLPELAREYWQRLPDAALTSWLLETAAAYYGVADPACIVPGPGSQALIQWLPRLVPRTMVCIIGPTYQEHHIAWTLADHEVVEVAALEAVPAEARVVVIANPNNPDGRTVPPDELLAATAGKLLVVDEAFADVLPEVGLAGRVDRPDLVVIRSFGKFFGLAGMRLGFALLGEPLAGRLRRALGPWAVSGPAAAVGAVALADSSWIRAARVRLTAASSRLDGLLMRAGLRVVGGTTLFRLVDHARASELFDTLARQAILVRQFPLHPTWLRFGIPGSDDAFERLGDALAQWRPPPSLPATAPIRPRPALGRRPPREDQG